MPFRTPNPDDPSMLDIVNAMWGLIVGVALTIMGALRFAWNIGVYVRGNSDRIEKLETQVKLLTEAVNRHFNEYPIPTFHTSKQRDPILPK